VSIGVAVNQGANDTVDAMLARADGAMYLAKANGRNRVESG
jgi:PleD family two-component response regulator